MNTRTYTLKTLVAAVAMALPFVTTSAVAQDATSLATPTPNYTAEQNIGYNGAYYKHIGLKYALQAGADGHGILVADLDSGVDQTHSKTGEFMGRIGPQTNIVGTTATMTLGYTDDNGHGTATMGLIGASINGAGMFGASPYASLMPVKVLDANGNGAWTTISKGIDTAVTNKARVINMSLGGTVGDASLVTSLTKAVNANTLVVVAAGNSAGANPMFPAVYAKEAWANGSILAVGASSLNPTYTITTTTSSYKIGLKTYTQTTTTKVLNPYDQWTDAMASFSNLAGSAMNFYLVAPGSGLTTTAKNGAYVGFSGTSAAAPVVAGAAADLMSLWPRLTAAQTGQILLVTANPTICGYTTVNPVCGHGLLDLNKAMQPVGATVVPTAMGTAISTSKALVSVGPAAGLAPVKAMSAVNSVVLDSYSRDFYTPASTFVAAAPKSSLNASDLFAVTDSHTRVAGIESENLNMMVVSKFATDADKLGLVGEARDLGSLASATMTMKFNGKELSFGTGGFTNKYFGLAETHSVAFYGKDAMVNPYLGLAESNNYYGGGFALSADTKVRMGVVSNGRLNPTVALMSTSLDTSKATGSLVEIDHRFGDVNVVTSVGKVNEASKFLTASSGVAGLQNGSTSFVSFGGSYKMDKHFTAVATYSVGSSTGSGGLLATDAAVKTNAMSLGLIGRNLYSKGDTLSLAMTLPMAVTSGTMTMNVPTGVDITGKAHFTNVAASMVPDARERDFEMSYTFKPTKTSSMSLVGVTRMNAGNDATAPADHAVGMRWTTMF